MVLGLLDKKVLITGSTSGIGQAIARTFLIEGASVLLNGRNESKLQFIKTKFQDEFGEDKVLSFCGDMTENKVMHECMQFVETKWNKLDILVPNLGTGKPLGVDRLLLDEWKYMMEHNLYTAVELIAIFNNLLENGTESNIVLVSSVVAYERANAPYAYAAAKGALLTLNKYLAVDYAKKNIRVNCVVPGNVYFKGGRWEELFLKDEAGTKKYIEDNVPMGRFAKPEEIADTVVFLASVRSSFTTGAVFVVDGGQKRSI